MANRSGCPNCGGTKTVMAVDNRGQTYEGYACCIIDLGPPPEPTARALLRRVLNHQPTCDALPYELFQAIRDHLR